MWCLCNFLPVVVCASAEASSSHQQKEKTTVLEGSFSSEFLQSLTMPIKFRFVNAHVMANLASTFSENKTQLSLSVLAVSCFKNVNFKV